MKQLAYPFAEDEVRSLRCGELVRLTGRLFTARDRVHKFLYEGGTCPVDLRDGAVYHCGPVVVRKGRGWQVRAAGPTTSIREEPYMATLIERHGIRLVIGKGGMGEATRTACVRCGCAYLQAVGGAAGLIASRVTGVEGVHLEREFGPTEAMWVLDVCEFEVCVTMDSCGKSLYDEIASSSADALMCVLADQSDRP